MSLWAEYVGETLGRTVIERQYGFASYIIKDDDCYLEDLFVAKLYRGHRVAHSLAEAVRQEAIAAGCKTLTTTINCLIRDPSTSLKTCLAFGFKIYQTSVNVIVLRMEV